jgi:hypothetical protein
MAVGVGFATAPPAAAKVLKTKSGQVKELALTVGSGIEFTTDSEETQYDFPFLVEYGVTENLQLTIEPDYIVLQSTNGNSVSGIGDLETSLTYEFLSMRRHRPSLSAEGLIKWPTASRGEFGTGKADYSLGVIVSKEFVHMDVDFNAVYTIMGSPPSVQLPNILELSLAMEWHLSRVLDLEGEMVTAGSSGSGFHRRPGTIGGGGGLPSVGSSEKGGRDTEGTLALAELLSARLKLEQGVAINFDGSWQVVCAWEWDFGEGQ